MCGVRVGDGPQQAGGVRVGGVHAAGLPQGEGLVPQLRHIGRLAIGKGHRAKLPIPIGRGGRVAASLQHPGQVGHPIRQAVGEGMRERRAIHEPSVTAHPRVVHFVGQAPARIGGQAGQKLPGKVTRQLYSSSKCVAR